MNTNRAIYNEMMILQYNTERLKMIYFYNTLENKGGI